jgi:hypothetical protein
MGALNYPGERGEQPGTIRAFGGTVDLFMFTARLPPRLGQIAVVWRLKNKKAMCVYFSMVTIFYHPVLSVPSIKTSPYFVYHRDTNQPP